MAILRVCAKCVDNFSAKLIHQQGHEMKSHDGYVPNFMPGDHYGDYIEIDIDTETGMIVNWTNPPLKKVLNDLNGA